MTGTVSSSPVLLAGNCTLCIVGATHVEYAESAKGPRACAGDVAERIDRDLEDLPVLDVIDDAVIQRFLDVKQAAANR